MASLAEDLGYPERSIHNLGLVVCSGVWISRPLDGFECRSTPAKSPREVALSGVRKREAKLGLVYYLRSPTRSGDALFENGSYHGLVLHTLAPDSCDSSRVVDFLGADDKPSVFELVLETDSKFYSHKLLPTGCEERDSTRQKKAGPRNFAFAPVRLKGARQLVRDGKFIASEVVPLHKSEKVAASVNQARPIPIIPTLWSLFSGDSNAR